MANNNINLNIEMPEMPGNKTETKEQIKTPEQESSVEQVAEKAVEQNIEQLPKEGKEGEIGVGGAGVVTASNQAQQEREQEKKIEETLAKNLDDIFLGMPPEKQTEFKVKGEETAKKVNELLRETTVKVKKIVSLIKKWLSIIPGVNKFFLEQEAKIKTDELMRMKRDNEL